MAKPGDSCSHRKAGWCSTCVRDLVYEDMMRERDEAQTELAETKCQLDEVKRERDSLLRLKGQMARLNEEVRSERDEARGELENYKRGQQAGNKTEALVYAHKEIRLLEQQLTEANKQVAKWRATASTNEANETILDLEGRLAEAEAKLTEWEEKWEDMMYASRNEYSERD